MVKIPNFFDSKSRSKLYVWVFILSIFLILRLPSWFHNWWYGDENIYMSIGQNMSAGKELYTQIWDHKPPFIYLIYFLSHQIFGNLLFPLRVFSTFLGLLEIFGFYLVSKFIFGFKDKFILIATFLLALVLSDYLEASMLNGENIFVAFIWLGSGLFGYIFSKYNQASSLNQLWQEKLQLQPTDSKFKTTRVPVIQDYLLLHLASIFWSLAIFTKIHALLEISCLLALFCISLFIFDSHLFKQKLTFLSIFSLPAEIFKTIWNTKFYRNFVFILIFWLFLPWLILFSYYFFNSSIDQLLYALWGYNQEYIEVSKLQVFNLNLPISGLNLRFFLLFVAILLSSFGLVLRKIQFNISWWIIWFSITAFGVLIPERNYPHYLLQILPIFLLNLIFALNWLFDYKNQIWSVKILPIFTSFLIWIFFLQAFVGDQILVLNYYYPNAQYLGFAKVLTNKQSLQDWHGNFLSDQQVLITKINQLSANYSEIYIFANRPDLYFLSGKAASYKYVVDYHYPQSELNIIVPILEQNPSLNLVVLDKESRQYADATKLLRSSFQKQEGIEKYEFWTRI